MTQKQSLTPVNNSMWLDLPAKITPTSLTLPKSLSYDKWAEMGPRIARIERFTKWALSDWLNYGEGHYGETYVQAVDATGFEPNYLAIVKYVGAAVEISRRRQSLSFSHHRLVAPLEPEAQERFLAQAEKHGWSREELREAVSKFRNVSPEKKEMAEETDAELSNTDNLCLLLDSAEHLAIEKKDGHLTIMRFTTGWKVMLGTPDLDTGKGRSEIAALAVFESLEAALQSLWCAPGKCSCWGPISDAKVEQE